MSSKRKLRDVVTVIPRFGAIVTRSVWNNSQVPLQVRLRKGMGFSFVHGIGSDRFLHDFGHRTARSICCNGTIADIGQRRCVCLIHQ